MVSNAGCEPRLSAAETDFGSRVTAILANYLSTSDEQGMKHTLAWFSTHQPPGSRRGRMVTSAVPALSTESVCFA
ncbi:hypothetical protein O9K51_04606 [Purpureocillium lavendulum]|uniref:Uncharacterized protein n=1 Tax=Purpureocillium lavendulum TaxID=1247861 RepID=A0AB34FVM8_9HYPO|nr:hypothetical protein O9K51_04606 [Purpureocillium lavendulum]